LLATLAALALQALVWGARRSGQPGGTAALLVGGIGADRPACIFITPLHRAHHVEGGRADGASFGTLMLGRNLGGFAGPVLLPLLVEFRAEPPLGLAWFALITLGGVALVWGLGRLTARRPIAQGTSR
jgi:hypothetical protein